MAVTAFVYANVFERAFAAEIDFLGETMAALLTDTTPYVPNQDTHEDGADVTNEVSTANGYTTAQAGAGENLLSKTHTNTLNVSGFDIADPAWTATGAGFSARIAVFLDTSTGVASTNPLFSWMDFGQTETASGGGTFTIAMAAAPGLATITAADASGFP